MRLNARWFTLFPHQDYKPPVGARENQTPVVRLLLDSCEPTARAQRQISKPPFSARAQREIIMSKFSTALGVAALVIGATAFFSQAPAAAQGKSARSQYGSATFAPSAIRTPYGVRAGNTVATPYGLRLNTAVPTAYGLRNGVATPYGVRAYGTTPTAYGLRNGVATPYGVRANGSTPTAYGIRNGTATSYGVRANRCRPTPYGLNCM